MGSAPLSDSDRIYLDHAATTPLRQEVRELLERLHRSLPGNPSSLHREGREARECLEAAREAILRSVHGGGFRAVFTGGGTESDNTAILGVLAAMLGERSPSELHVVASAVEHPAVHGALETAARLGVASTLVPVDDCARVDPAAVLDALRPETVLVSVMSVNNEVGTVQPLREIAGELRRRGVLFHTDAVQHLGKLPLDVASLGADLLSVSAHKIYAPKGVGGLLLREGIQLWGIARGGPQELGLRAGTENVTGAAAFGRAAELACQEIAGEQARLASLGRRLQDGLLRRIDGVRVHGADCARAPHIVAASFEDVEGESLLTLLDRLGVSVSTGSACSVGARRPSHVLKAMGLGPREVRGSIRFSLGRDSDESRVDAALDRVEEAVRRLRKVGIKSGAR